MAAIAKHALRPIESHSGLPLNSTNSPDDHSKLARLLYWVWGLILEKADRYISFAQRTASLRFARGSFATTTATFRALSVLSLLHLITSESLYSSIPLWVSMLRPLVHSAAQLANLSLVIIIEIRSGAGTVGCVLGDVEKTMGNNRHFSTAYPPSITLHIRL